jgi:hypothetical protein
MSGPAENPSAVRGDPFSKVVGAGRGLSDPAVLGTELDDCKQALAEAREALETERDIRRVLEIDLGRADRELEQVKAARNNALESATQSGRREAARRDERDRARYAAMRSGQRDPVPNGAWQRVHHGVWTPGRPYLAYQHVWHPRTGECYRTDNGGAPTGELPGTGRHWQPCIETRDTCPKPRPIREDLLYHPLEGPALRQTELWWDRNHKALNFRDPVEVADDYLENILKYLRENATEMCSKEADWEEAFVPCPWVAYSSPRSWLNDTPLMRALVQERRRRQAVKRREARREGDG